MMTMASKCIKEARMLTTTTNTNTAAFRSVFEGGGKGSLFCAPCLTSSSRRGFVSSLSGENGIGSNIPVAFLEEKKIKNEVEVEESEVEEVEEVEASIEEEVVEDEEDEDIDGILLEAQHTVTESLIAETELDEI